MASENAAAVAKEVIQTVQNGKKVNLQKIQQKHGYSDKSAKAMKAKQTKTYKKTILPFASMLEKEISKIQLEMDKRDIGDEKYKDLAEVLDRLNKNLQLASGGDTERISITGINYVIPDGNNNAQT